MKHIAYFSGGKDSTAMLILIKKNELPLDEILYADVGSWMWESVDSHIKEVEDYMDFPVTKLDISHLIQEKFKKYGFPSPLIRWCTGIKRD